MKRTTTIFLMLAVFAAAIPNAVCKDDSRGKTGRDLPGEIETDLAPPPTPYEFDIIEAVYARFPGINRSEVEQFLQNNFAYELRRFRTLAVDRQEEATDFLSKLVREVLSLLETKRRNPVAFEKKLALKRLETRADRLAREIRLAGGDEKKRLQRELHDTAVSIFDIKQELMKTDVEQMSRELALLKELINKREASREAIVNRRVVNLVGDREDLEW